MHSATHADRSHRVAAQNSANFNRLLGYEPGVGQAFGFVGELFSPGAWGKALSLTFRAEEAVGVSAARLRDAGVPDWSIRLAPSQPGTLYSTRSPIELERVVSSRIRYLGETPDKFSPTGTAVVERMRAEGFIRGQGALLPGNPTHLEVLSGGQWHRIDRTIDMAHKTDAVVWWNEIGRYYGAKAPEVRAFMLNADNYSLQHQSINGSAGAILGRSTTYLPPAPSANPFGR